MADVTNEIMTNDKTKILSGEFLNFYTPRRQRIRSFKVYFSPKQEGSGTPSPENVRPISGWTGVEVNHCGKNLFSSDVELGGFSEYGLNIDRQDRLRSKEYIQVKQNTQYVLSLVSYNTAKGPLWLSVSFYDSNDYITNRIGYTSWTKCENKKFVFSTPSKTKFIRMLACIGSNVILSLDDFSGFQLELGSEATEYIPYKTNLLLPKEYQEVEYIESTGTQFIDTGFCPNNGKYVFTMKIVPTEVPTNRDYFRVFGNVSGSSNNVYRFQTRINGSQYRFCPSFGTRASSEQTVNQSYYIRNNVPYEIIINGIDQSYSVGDFSSSFPLTAGGANETPIVIFASARTVDLRSKFQLYYFSVTGEDAQTILNLIPCYRKSDNEPGMYDTVSKTFYTNSGTGEFILGPAVNRYDIDWSEDVGTVYGGYVDLVSGELVETHECDRLSTVLMGPNYHTDTAIYFVSDLQNYGIREGNTSGLVDLKCNYLESKTNTIYDAPDKNINCIHKRWSTQNQVGIVLTRAEVGINVDDSLDVMNSKTLDYLTNNSIYASYKLATPITHQLSPTTLSTLMFDNNFWSNADRIEIEYDYIGIFDAITSRKNIFTATPHTATAKNSIVSFGTDMAADLKECKIHFLPKQLGEGDPSPDNVRPIEGWDGITMYKNLNEDFYTYNVVGDASGATVMKINENSFRVSAIKKKYPASKQFTSALNLILNKKYIVDFDIVIDTLVDGHTCNFGFRNSANAFQADARVICPNSGHYNFVFTFDNLTRLNYLSLCEMSGNYVNFDATISNLKIYEVEEITIPFPQTIYGGYVDLIKGEIVETWHRWVEDGSRDPMYWPWTSSSDNNYKIPLFRSLSPNNAKDLYELSDDSDLPLSPTRKAERNINSNSWRISYGFSKYRANSASFAVSYPYNEIGDTKAELREYLANNPEEFVYRLEAPIHYLIDPHTLITLRGANTIWSNTNSDVEIAYWKHNDDSYQHVPSLPITSNDNFIIVTDDGYAIGEEDDFIVY